MVDARGHIPKASLGMELRAGHVMPIATVGVQHHLRAIAQCLGKGNRGAPVPIRINPPELPRLRALQNEATEIPFSESSVASSVSPGVGQRDHIHIIQLVR